MSPSMRHRLFSHIARGFKQYCIDSQRILLAPAMPRALLMRSNYHSGSCIRCCRNRRWTNVWRLSFSRGGWCDFCSKSSCFGTTATAAVPAGLAGHVPVKVVASELQIALQMQISVLERSPRKVSRGSFAIYVTTGDTFKSLHTHPRPRFRVEKFEKIHCN